MSFANPHFQEPQWLLLAVLGPAAVMLLHYYAQWARRRQLQEMASKEAIGVLTASHSPVKRLVKQALLAIAVCGIGLALARPQWGERQDSTRVLGEDVIFILDCSRSMLASDVTPNRLERAKLAILDYIQNRGHGRVGLVAFSGQAFLQCPLTFDYNAFQDALSAVDERTIPVAGTDIGRALDEAYRAMDKSHRRKLMVMLTDGEDLEKSGTKMAEKLRDEGLVVFTLGVGTAAGSEITVYNEQGQPALLRDSKGQVVRSRLDEPTLRKIAEATHGAYFPLGPLGEGLARVRVAVEQLETTGVPAQGKKFGVDRYHVPIAMVLAILVMESIVGTRRTKFKAAAMTQEAKH